MKTSGRIIAKILTLCGVSLTCTACYAAPYSDYEVKGLVTGEAGEVIEGIQVSVRPYEEGEYTDGIAYSDKNGRYMVSNQDTYLRRTMWIVAGDVDGAENGGEFRTQTKQIEIDASDYKGGSGFYKGKVSKTVDFTLELKKEEEPDHER